MWYSPPLEFSGVLISIIPCFHLKQTLLTTLFVAGIMVCTGVSDTLIRFWTPSTLHTNTDADSPADFFQVVALSEPLNKAMLSSKASREEFAEAIIGKVLGWGLWVGCCERKWTSTR